MSPHDIFLETAHRIGERLVKQALWEGEVCTWTIQRPNVRTDGEYEAVPSRAEGAVYQGTAGIALFLGTLYPHTQTSAVRQTAEGALRHALAEAATWPTNNFGFHSGRVGVAYVATQLGMLLDEPSYLTEARSLLHPLLGQAHREHGLDVIAGAAGAIPALIQLSTHLGDDDLLTLGMQLGDRLIAQAQREPQGWSWGTMRVGTVRNLLGLAHGTAGIGLALHELYAATGDANYLYVAEQALFYENLFFDEARCNWPDFRHDGLSDLLHGQGIKVLTDYIRSGGEISPYTPRYMSAWCHGAPGIGLARLRAYELFHLDHHRTDALLALQTTDASLDRQGNYSLCHGLAGNAETLLVGAEVLNDPHLRERAEAYGLQGWKTYEQAGQSWPCGTLGNGSDPSLLLGEAGIGYFYLRLYAPETPSVLLLRGAPQAVSQAPTTAAPLHRAYVNNYFGRTLRVINALSQNGRPALTNGEQLPVSFEVAPPVQVHHDLIHYIETASHREALLDAFLPEKTRFELAMALDDFSDEFLAGLQQPAPGEVDWAGTTFQLAPETRLLETKWDWDAWLDQDAEKRPALPDGGPVFFVVYRQDNQIHLRRVAHFTAVVLHHLEHPASLDQIMVGLREALGSTDIPDIDTLRQTIAAQLHAAYEANMIHCLQEQPIMT